ncbi:hypothetical protein ACFOTA_10985 [Chitinophaga sp. GCM10012297]|uniref:GerMN domain-containing protein n=1 Tax=Chitinophaga chungangae TaxID=2821488 RepID=A0ABS3YDJ1_9BACT|nr:hypothetical protein [Chitinophaga chungangae]MBO9152734.1 hypothetical protein [Chitinophaga chungangae]
MRNLLYAAGLLALLAAGCGPNTSQSTITQEEKQAQGDTINELVAFQKDIVIRPLSGYFVKNTIKQNDSIVCWVINNPKEMQQVFGMAKTVNNVIDTVDFNSQLLTALTLRISSLVQKIELISSKQEGSTVELHFKIYDEEPTVKSFSMAAAWLGAIPKTPEVKTVKFYNGDKLIQSVDVGLLEEVMKEDSTLKKY